jgi:hypothetical protein
MEKKEVLHGDIQEIDAGEALVSWETWEYPPHERSTKWYIIASLIGIGLIFYSILTANFLFAIIILMMGVIMLVNALRHPDRIEVHITTLGLVVGNEFHSYKEIKDFSLVYEPPDVKLLYVDFNSRIHPLVAIPLEEVNPNDVRASLLPFAFENIEREEETLTDMVRRLYKI